MSRLLFEGSIAIPLGLLNSATYVSPFKNPKFPATPARVETILEVTLINLITLLEVSAMIIFPLEESIAIPLGLLNRDEFVGPSKYPPDPGTPARVETLLEMTLISLITQLLLSGRRIFPLKGSTATPVGLLNRAEVVGPS